MKKYVSYLFVFSVFTFLLIGCGANNFKHLTRVDVEKPHVKESTKPTLMITNQKTIKELKSILSQIKWDKNTTPSMARKEAITATLFFKEDKNKPETLVVHRIWFNENGTAIILSNNKSESYGTLEKEHAKKLKNILLQK